MRTSSSAGGGRICRSYSCDVSICAVRSHPDIEERLVEGWKSVRGRCIRRASLEVRGGLQPSPLSHPPPSSSLYLFHHQLSRPLDFVEVCLSYSVFLACCHDLVNFLSLMFQTFVPSMKLRSVETLWILAGMVEEHQRWRRRMRMDCSFGTR